MQVKLNWNSGKLTLKMFIHLTCHFVILVDKYKIHDRKKYGIHMVLLKATVMSMLKGRNICTEYFSHPNSAYTNDKVYRVIKQEE